MKVIFLDVDGVLNRKSTRAHIPGTRYTGLDAVLVKRFKHIIKRTGMSIVISSSWRYHRECMEYLRTKLGKRISEKIIGSTPEICGRPRSHEIDTWLAEHPEVDDFVVIDDLRFDGLSKYGERFIQTDMDVGLTEEMAIRCIRLLETVTYWRK